MPTDGRDRFSRSQYGPGPGGLELLPPLDRARRGPLEPQDLRPGVGQHHAGVGRRPDARQLDDLDPAQRSTAVGHRRIVTRAARDGQAGPPAPSWGRAHRPRPRTSDHHRRPHRLQRRPLAAHGHRPGHRGRLHAQARQLPRRDRLGPVPGAARSRSPWATPPRFPPRPPWRPDSCACSPRRAAGCASGSRAPSRSARACPRAPPSRSRSCSPSATTPTPSRWPATARRPSAARAPTSACSIPWPSPAPPPGHALPHRLRHARDPSGRRSRRGGLRDRAQRDAPPPHRHALRHPARRVRAGRAHPGPAARRSASSAT